MSNYRVRLLAYREDTEDNVTFGTCELCMGTGTAENPVYTFEFTDTETGKEEVRDVDGYFWSWGDYFTVYVDNVVTFGDWLENNQITVDSLDMGYSDLQDLVFRWQYPEVDTDEPD